MFKDLVIYYKVSLLLRLDAIIFCQNLDHFFRNFNNKKYINNERK